jgi:hypothetical protein
VNGTAWQCRRCSALQSVKSRHSAVAKITPQRFALEVYQMAAKHYQVGIKEMAEIMEYAHARIKGA